MYGAILGDIIGSPYEFDMGDKSKDFPLFSDESYFTDDTVMTIAVAETFMSAKTPKPEHFEHGWYLSEVKASDEAIKKDLVQSMQKWGRRYPSAGYGVRFSEWLESENPQPYNSWGNGSAMRVAPIAWLYDDLSTVRHMARLSAGVTHNHPEGIKGAEATASAIFLGRAGHSKGDIKAYIEEEFHYDLSRTCNEIRPTYYHVESCQETVPEAITAFLEGNSFEDVIRTAVSLGGDCDTLTCIAGAIAEGFYGVPDHLKDRCVAFLTKDLLDVLFRFDSALNSNSFQLPETMI